MAMNAQNFTQKSLEALESARGIALENNNMQICPEHLLYALVDQDGGLIGSLSPPSPAAGANRTRSTSRPRPTGCSTPLQK